MFRIAFLFAIALGMVVPSHAADITWTVENLTFPDGGIITGSFVWNNVAEIATDVDIVTTADRNWSVQLIWTKIRGSGTLASGVTGTPEPSYAPVLGLIALLAISFGATLQKETVPISREKYCPICGAVTGGEQVQEVRVAGDGLLM